MTQAELTISITRLGATVGAEVRRLDLREPPDDTTMGRLRTAFLDHGVLVFRGQRLTPADHVAFTSRWGDVEVHPQLLHVEGYPALSYLDNALSEKLGTDCWHSDAMALEQPPLGSLLYARELPEVGGDTMFANQYLAYEALSAGFQRLLEPLRAVNVFDASLAEKLGTDMSRLPKASHPIVRTHPETGRRALYVSAYFTSHIEGMTPEESAPILEYLYRHATQAEFVYRHRWQLGDLLIWDNRCMQHYAVHDYGSQPRLMHRSTLLGDRPR